MNQKYRESALGFVRAPRLRLCAGWPGLQLRISLALIALAVLPARALDPAQPPGANFDLTHWCLSLPELGAPTIDPTNLVAGYTHTNWFYTGPDGAMVFWCPVTGGTTSNSSFPRSELREWIDPTNSAVNWTAFGTHVLDAECKVTQLPSTGKVIIGQIHGYTGAARPLLKLVFENGKIDAQLKVSPDADPDAHISFSNVAFNAAIIYQIKLGDGILTLTINGTSQSANILQNDPNWANQTFYFKAGSYCQDNSGSSSEGARVAFYRLTARHRLPGPEAPSITIQPVHQNVIVGTTASFNVAAAGTAPLSFQWRKDDVDWPGATNSTLTLSNVQTNNAGNFSAVAANFLGAATSGVAALTVSMPDPVPPLAEALDAPGLVWTTNGSPAWFAQTNVTHDGADAAQSGTIPDGGTTTMQATVAGPGTLSFWWKVSSEKKKDALIFFAGGKEQARTSGEADWQRLAFKISSGSQLLQWSYTKNSSKTGGLDRAWVDQVIYIPNNVPTAPTIEAQPVSQAVGEQTAAAFSVLANGSTPLSYQWRLNGNILSNGVGVSGATTATLTLSSVQPAQAGNYSVVISNGAGSRTSAAPQLTVFTLAEVLDNPALTWLTSGPAPWAGQTGVTHDGVDAARSGAIAKGQTTTLQTTVTGPGSLSFWWKVSSKTNKDFAVCSVAGAEQSRISGEVNWQRRTISVPPGSQVLQWSYTKGGSSAGGQDRAWVDEVQFDLTSTDTLPTPPAIAEAIQRANDFYIATTTFQSNGWARGVYQTGNMRAYDVLNLDRYRQWAVQWGEYFHWQTGFRGPASADGEVCGQTYIDLFLLDPQPVRIAAVKAGIDARVAAAAVDDWWWIDAFYMAGPVYARLSKLYATNSYSEKMFRFYQDTKVRRGLFDPQYGLWYRDEAAKAATTAHGKRQVWARGNGWVIAALARVLEQLPANEPHRAEYITMLQTMAAALKPLQGADGMWRASLLDPTEVPNPETSSTALYTFALAWGIRHGYLDAAEYGPVVTRAWNGMVTVALHPDGTVGYAQPQGHVPEVATYDSASDHGTGAFLLAGSEVYLLAQGTPVVPAAVLAKGRSAAVPASVTPVVTRSGGKTILSWPAVPGKTYQVFYKDDLADAVWQPWIGKVVMDGSIASVEDAANTKPQRFYQVLEK